MSLVNGAISTDVILYTAGVAPGEYSLVLESYDMNSNGAVPATLKTDTISIIVEEPLNPPYFTEDLKTESLSTSALSLKDGLDLAERILES